MTLSVLDAVVGRRSIRRFLPDEVPQEKLELILQAAARAPSGTNFQPWQVHVVTGQTRELMSAEVRKAASNNELSLEHPYLPAEIKEPYRSRRRKVGFDLYALYGIDREDLPARREAMLRNFDFFGAPVGLFFTLDRGLERASWMDCGMFMQNVMILARSLGLETCAQLAWCEYGAVVREMLSIPPDRLLLTGMAVGYADWTAPENSLVSDREPLSEFVRFHR